jgi:hypothetical protein
MRCIFIPHLGKMGLAYFSPSECEVAHTSRGINGGSNQRARLGGGGEVYQQSINLCALASLRMRARRSTRFSFSEHIHPL